MVVGSSDWLGSVVFISGLSVSLIRKLAYRWYKEYKAEKRDQQTASIRVVIMSDLHKCRVLTNLPPFSFAWVVNPLTASEEKQATKEKHQAVLFDSGDSKRADTDKTGSSGQN